MVCIGTFSRKRVEYERGVEQCVEQTAIWECEVKFGINVRKKAVDLYRG